MSDAIIRVGGETILVDVTGGPGPAGGQGPAGASQIANLPVFVPAVTANGVADDSAAINAALANAAYSIVMLPAGVIGIAQAIVVPAGKTLLGAGRARTTIKVLAGFTIVGGHNHAVVIDGDDVCLRDFLIDGDKVDPVNRIQGTAALDCHDFNIERVDVIDLTGYGQFARGDASGFTYFTSGTYIDCRADNCQICFECMACDGISYVGCRAGDGDGDLIGTYFHPLTGSRNISYVDCHGKGEASVGWEISANVEAQFDILLLGSSAHITGGLGIAIVTNGAEGTRGLRLIGSRFTAEEYLAANLEHSSGQIEGCTFAGVSIAIAFDAQSGDYEWSVSNSEALCTAEAAANGYAILAESGARVRWSGGVISVNIDAAGSSATPISRGAGCKVVVSPETCIAPSTDVDGGGFTFRRLLPGGGNSSTSTTGSVIGATTDYEWTFPVEDGHRYRVSVRGGWFHGSLASSGRFGVLGAGGAAGSIRGEMYLNTSATARTSNFVTAITGLGNAAARVEATPATISEILPLGADLVFECTASGTLSIQIGTSNAAHGFTLEGLATLLVEEI